MITSKDELLVILLTPGRYRFHYSDSKFFKKINSLISSNIPITSGQTFLFDKLISKYYVNSLRGINLSLEQMLSLPWKSIVVETDPMMLTARVSLTHDNQLIIESPFKPSFNKQLASLSNIQFIWNKELKQHSTIFSTYNLKIIHSFLPKYFSSVIYCERITELLSVTEDYKDATVWDPILKRNGDWYYIAAINSVLYDQIKNLNLNADESTLFTLSLLGIDFDNDIIDTPEKKFMASTVYQCDISEWNKVTDWLKKLNIKYAFVTHEIRYINHTKNNKYKNDIQQQLADKGILTTSEHPASWVPKEAILIQEYGNNKMNYYGEHAIAKSIYIKNSHSIEVK